MPENNTEKLISLIFATSRLIKERSNGNAMGGFSILQFETLKYVSDNKNPTMKDVADYLSITPPSATSLIDHIVKSNELKRVQSKNDRRIVRLVITPKGRRKLNAGYHKKAKHLRQILSKLSHKDQESLIKILKNLHSLIK